MKEPYRKNAVLILSHDALCKLRLQRLYHGRRAFDDALKDEESDTLLGYKYFVSDHLDRVEGGSKPILFGDLLLLLDWGAWQAQRETSC